MRVQKPDICCKFSVLNRLHVGFVVRQGLHLSPERQLKKEGALALRNESGQDIDDISPDCSVCDLCHCRG